MILILGVHENSFCFVNEQKLQMGMLKKSKQKKNICFVIFKSFN